jgi:hypothetical protein
VSASSNLPVRAAGRRLTVGELREAIEGLSDNDLILTDGPAIVAVEHDPRGVRLALADGLSVGADARWKERQLYRGRARDLTYGARRGDQDALEIA